MKIRTAVIAVAVAVMSVVPLAGPAQAAHNCGDVPCGHPEDLCYVPIVKKLVPWFCPA